MLCFVLRYLVSRNRQVLTPDREKGDLMEGFYLCSLIYSPPEEARCGSDN